MRQIERGAKQESRNDAQRPPLEGGVGQLETGDRFKTDVENRQQESSQRHGQHRPLTQAPRHPGDTRETEIGEPFGRNRPRGVVERRCRRRAPALHQQQMCRKGRQIAGIGVQCHALDRRGGDQHQGKDQGSDMQRIDSRQAMNDEAAVIERALAETFEIDIAQDEARQDEEQVDPEIAVVDQTEMHRQVQFLDVGIEHDPQGCEEAQRGQGLDQIGLHGGGSHDFKRIGCLCRFRTGAGFQCQPLRKLCQSWLRIT